MLRSLVLPSYDSSTYHVLSTILLQTQKLHWGVHLKNMKIFNTYFSSNTHVTQEYKLFLPCSYGFFLLIWYTCNNLGMVHGRFWGAICYNFQIKIYNKIIWVSAWDFQQFGMCDQQRLKPACAYVQSDQSLCLSLEYSMSVKLLTEYHLELLSLKGGCTGWPEATLVKMTHCWKSHIVAQFS